MNKKSGALRLVIYVHILYRLGVIRRFTLTPLLSILGLKTNIFNFQVHFKQFIDVFVDEM
jgi:hypothetical protein